MTERSNQAALLSYKDEDHLDSENEVYRPKDHKLKRWVLISLGAVTLIVVALLSVILVLEAYTGVLRHGRAVLLNKALFLFPLIFIGLPLGILSILWAKNHWEDQMILQNEKLIYRKGNQQQVWVYKEIEKLDISITNIHFGGSIVGTRVKLILEDGFPNKWIVRNRFENMADLVDSIRRKILPHLYKRAVQKLAQGEKINFNANLEATREGFEINSKQFFWDELPKPVFNNKILILTGQNGQEELLKTNVNKINNLDLLLCLFENPPIFED